MLCVRLCGFTNVEYCHRLRSAPRRGGNTLYGLPVEFLYSALRVSTRCQCGSRRKGTAFFVGHPNRFSALVTNRHLVDFAWDRPGSGQKNSSEHPKHTIDEITLDGRPSGSDLLN